MACTFGNRRYRQERKDANHKRHVPAWLFDVFGKGIVIDSVLVDCSVRMLVSDDMTVTLIMRVSKNEPKVVMTCVSGRCFRRSDKHPLHDKGHRGCHHYDGGQALKERATCYTQRLWFQ